jgi:hypothetical protein
MIGFLENIHKKSTVKKSCGGDSVAGESTWAIFIFNSRWK